MWKVDRSTQLGLSPSTVMLSHDRSEGARSIWTLIEILRYAQDDLISLVLDAISTLFLRLEILQFLRKAQDSE